MTDIKHLTYGRDEQAFLEHFDKWSGVRDWQAGPFIEWKSTKEILREIGIERTHIWQTRLLCQAIRNLYDGDASKERRISTGILFRIPPARKGKKIIITEAMIEVGVNIIFEYKRITDSRGHFDPRDMAIKMYKNMETIRLSEKEDLHAKYFPNKNT